MGATYCQTPVCVKKRAELLAHGQADFSEQQLLRNDTNSVSLVDFCPDTMTSFTPLTLPRPPVFGMTLVNFGRTGQARLIQSDSSAGFSYELSGNLN